MRVKNNPGSGAMFCLKRIVRILFFIIFPIVLFNPIICLASWNCLKEIHKTAISDAINLSPAELRNILSQYSDEMLEEIPRLHLMSESQRASFSSYYETIINLAKARDSQKHESMSRFFSRITIYPFLKNLPIKSYDYCDENKIINQATIVFDGFNSTADYSDYASWRINLQSQYQELNTSHDKMLYFYNKLVNDIIDIWIAIWTKSGRDLKGIPEKNTVVRGPNSKPLTAYISIEEIKKVGYGYLNNNKYPEAIQAFSDIIRIKPNDTDAIYGLALAQFKIKDYGNVGFDEIRNNW